MSSPAATPRDALKAAMATGTLDAVAEAIAAGADASYVDANGYDAIIDAAYRMQSSPALVGVLRLLLQHGARPDGVSSYRETAIAVLAATGRFDGLRVLVEAGASPAPLEWTALHRAAAWGTLADVEAAGFEDLGTRDASGRTPWHTAALRGDLDIAERLFALGVAVDEPDGRSSTALHLAARRGHAALLGWLLDRGASVYRRDATDDTALAAAVRADDLESVELLLERSGAMLPLDTEDVRSRGVARALARRGFALGAGGKRALVGLAPDPSPLDPALAGAFQAGWKRTFGGANPERMEVPFWLAMIRSGASAYAARAAFGATSGPVWCADRFGQSMTLLADGRVVWIGGEHEDAYDPDFCIYNDVIVHDPDGAVTVYGYPPEVFPPTDFHTATELDGSVYVIGSLGYHRRRRFGHTQVLRLDLRTFAMVQVETTGEAPGWIHGHRAERLGSLIRVRGGQIAQDERTHAANTQAFVLDVTTGEWRREELGTARPPPDPAALLTVARRVAEVLGVPPLDDVEVAPFVHERLHGSRQYWQCLCERIVTEVELRNYLLAHLYTLVQARRGLFAPGAPTPPELVAAADRALFGRPASGEPA